LPSAGLFILDRSDPDPLALDGDGRSRLGSRIRSPGFGNSVGAKWSTGGRGITHENA